jgi:lactate dehydrogenase-like 2-hydroxyacid dehydrogenase
MYVCNVPDYGTEEVADHALGLALSMVRNISQFNTKLKGEIGHGHGHFLFRELES